jgi:hypothetical protein
MEAWSAFLLNQLSTIEAQANYAATKTLPPVMMVLIWSILMILFKARELMP